jgi:hypothetical protein
VIVSLNVRVDDESRNEKASLIREKLIDEVFEPLVIPPLLHLMAPFQLIVDQKLTLASILAIRHQLLPKDWVRLEVK